MYFLTDHRGIQMSVVKLLFHDVNGCSSDINCRIFNGNAYITQFITVKRRSSLTPCKKNLAIRQIYGKILSDKRSFKIIQRGYEGEHQT